jgi:hypothetical protein
MSLLFLVKVCKYVDRALAKWMTMGNKCPVFFMWRYYKGIMSNTLEATSTAGVE